MIRRDLRPFIIGIEQRIADVIRRVDENGEGIVLVLDEAGGLTATVTDGDIRRAMLAGASLDTGVDAVLEKGKPDDAATPTVVAEGTPVSTMLRIMTDGALRHLPVVDAEGRVVGLALLRDLVDEYEAPLEAIVMAGGYGRRMLPLTEDLPKPLLPVGNKPVMERIIENLKAAGIRQVNVALHHLPQKIIDHFGDGSAFGVGLSYVRENEPLGTAGALRLIDRSADPLLVVNGDVLSDVDYRDMLAYHREHKAELTMAVRAFDVRVPYGIVQCDGPSVVTLDEKPSENVLVNAGIYLLEPQAIDLIPEGRPFDMPELITALVEAGRRVVAFLVHEYWVDIGRHEDYEMAQVRFETDARRS